MSKYIDAEKLIAEIKRRMEMHRKASADGYIIDPNRLDEDEDILSLITSLQQEQPVVDLEKVLSGFTGYYAHENSGEYPSAIDIARHFYELGKKVRK